MYIAFLLVSTQHFYFISRVIYLPLNIGIFWPFRVLPNKGNWYAKYKC